MTASKVVFDPFSNDFFNAPYATYRRLRDEEPVYYNERYDFYALTRHADVAAAIKDFETFSSSRGVDLEMVQSGNPVPPLIIMMDPPQHRRMRNLVNKVFTPRAIERQRRLVVEQIERFLAAADPVEFDVVQDFSALFPVEVITRLLGVPAELRQRVRLLLDKTLEREYGNVATPEEGVQAGIETGLIYYNIIQERHANPQDDMISDLIATEVERDGVATKLDDVEIAGFASMLGGAGAETVTKLVGNAVVTFSEHPDQWQMLLDDRSRIPAAVEELLRWEAPAQYLVRYTMKDVELHGTRSPPETPSCSVWARPTGTSGRSPTRTFSTSTGTAARRRTWGWATGCTVAWAPRWPGWRAPSRWTSCWITCRATRSCGRGCAGWP